MKWISSSTEKCKRLRSRSVNQRTPGNEKTKQNNMNPNYNGNRLAATSTCRKIQSRSIQSRSIKWTWPSNEKNIPKNTKQKHKVEVAQQCKEHTEEYEMAQGMRWGTASITTIARHDALYTARRAALYSQEQLRVTNMTTTAKRAVLYHQDLLRVTNMTTTAPIRKLCEINFTKLSCVFFGCGCKS